jgi:DNA-binding NtrC family response regulator
MRRLLERQGHDVLEADSSSQAKLLFADNAERISVLLTDMSLGTAETGGGHGSALASDLRQVRPDLPVVFTSGYDSALRSLPLVEGFDFLQKPVTPAALALLLAKRFGERAD